MKRICSAIVLLMFGLICFPQKNHNNTVHGKMPGYKLALPPVPIDPQLVQDQDNMTWGDYKPIPGKNWSPPWRLPTVRPGCIKNAIFRSYL